MAITTNVKRTFLRRSGIRKMFAKLASMVAPRRRVVDRVTLNPFERTHVDRGVVDAEGVLEAAQLRDALHQRQLPTLETHGDRVAGALALGATAGCLSAFASDAASYPATGSRRTGRWAELVDLHREPLSSSPAGVTSIRWGTRAIIPRISGRSGSTLVRPVSYTHLRA